MEKSKSKDRGKFLTVLLIFAIFGVLSALYSLINPNTITLTYGSISSWYFAYVAFGVTIGVINILGIYLWKRWVIYTLTLSAIATILIQLFILQPINPTMRMYTILSSIVGIAIWYWAIYRKWSYFE